MSVKFSTDAETPLPEFVFAPEQIELRFITFLGLAETETRRPVLKIRLQDLRDMQLSEIEGPATRALLDRDPEIRARVEALGVLVS